MPTKKGRCRYRGVWREPKLFVVSVVGPDGRQEHTCTPLIDATLAGPDAMFHLLGNILVRVHIEQAERVLFVADGAHWIWKRIQPLCVRLGLTRGVELLDFFHVVEYLSAVAELKKSWTPVQRWRWVKWQQRRLLTGRASAAIEAVVICRGCLSKAIIDSSQAKPAKDLDVHMAVKGLDYSCATCHNFTNHQSAGSRYQAVAKDASGVVIPGRSSALRAMATSRLFRRGHRGEGAAPTLFAA